MEKVGNFDEALSLLKDGFVLLIGTDNFFKPSYVKLEHGKFLVFSNGMKAKLNLEIFKDLYERCSFYLYDDDHTSIDEERDHEYYSWKHK